MEYIVLTLELVYYIDKHNFCSATAVLNSTKGEVTTLTPPPCLQTITVFAIQVDVKTMIMT